MPFKSLELIEDVKIDSIITIHYFEYMSDYSFPGESHDFWEFLCVDKGEVEITADNRAYTLKKGEIFLLKDAREHATDSRIYGAVNKKDTLGKVVTLIRRNRL